MSLRCIKKRITLLALSILRIKPKCYRFYILYSQILRIFRTFFFMKIFSFYYIISFQSFRSVLFLYLMKCMLNSKSVNSTNHVIGIMPNGSNWFNVAHVKMIPVLVLHRLQWPPTSILVIIVDILTLTILSS